MTPRSRRYFARKRTNGILDELAPIFEAYRMCFDAWKKITTPIPKYPPGTVHPGGPAIVGEPGPLLIVRPGQVAVTAAPKEPAMLFPGTKVIPYGWNTPHPLLEKPVADIANAIDRQVLADIMHAQVREAYSRLPDFAQGGVKKTKP